MKPNVLLTIAAIYLALLGLGFLLVPDTMVFGALGASAPVLLVATLRAYGGTFLGIATLNWMARNADASPARNAIFLGNTVGFSLATITAVLGLVSGAPSMGWLFAIINGLIVVAFIVVGRANMMASKS
jgi:hypothetical protein